MNYFIFNPANNRWQKLVERGKVMQFFTDPPVMVWPALILEAASMLMMMVFVRRDQAAAAILGMITACTMVAAGYDIAWLDNGQAIFPSPTMAILALLAISVVWVAIVPLAWRAKYYPQAWGAATLASGGLMMLSEYGRQAGVGEWGASVAIFAITTTLLAVVTAIATARRLWQRFNSRPRIPWRLRLHWWDRF